MREQSSRIRSLSALFMISGSIAVAIMFGMFDVERYRN
jgi:hypothetical protein